MGNVLHALNVQRGCDEQQKFLRAVEQAWHADVVTPAHHQ
jgi:hypothetical protein